MHKDEGPNTDTTTIAGKSLAKTSPLPPTTINPKYWTAMGQEIINAIQDAGITLEASAASDQSAGWVQLKAAIRILANKRLSEDLPYVASGFGGMSAAPADFTMTSASQTKTPSRFVNRFNTALGVPCFATLTENDTNYADAIIICYNVSAQTMLIAGAVVPPGTGRLYKYDSTRSGGNKWVALSAKTSDDILEGTGNLFWTDGRFDTRFGAQINDAVENAIATDTPVQTAIQAVIENWVSTGAFDTHFNDNFNAVMKKGTFTIEVRGAANNELLGSGTARYHVHNGLVTLIVPILDTNATPSTVVHNSFHLRGPSDTNLPTAIQGALALTSAPLDISLGGSPEQGKWYVHGSDYVTIYRAGNANFAIGSSIVTEAFSIQYPIS
jgi:hypothetical protein